MCMKVGWPCVLHLAGPNCFTGPDGRLLRNPDAPKKNGYIRLHAISHGAVPYSEGLPT